MRLIIIKQINKFWKDICEWSIIFIRNFSGPSSPLNPWDTKRLGVSGDSLCIWPPINFCSESSC